MLNHHNLFICVNGIYCSVIAITVRTMFDTNNIGHSQSHFALSFIRFCFFSLDEEYERKETKKVEMIFFSLNSQALDFKCWRQQSDEWILYFRYIFLLCIICLIGTFGIITKTTATMTTTTQTMTIASVNIFTLFY